MNAAVLITVSGGVAETESVGDVDIALIDIDNIEAGDELPFVKKTKEFESLMKRCGLTDGLHFNWEA